LTDGASLFTAFLKQEFSQENIEFWTEVENYKKSKPSRLTAKARKIYEEYIAVKATKEVSHVAHFCPHSEFLLPLFLAPADLLPLPVLLSDN
jgi:hypothetical protein